MEVATKKQQALSLLAAGSPLEKVAHSIGVHRATLWRWKKDPKFVAEWNKMLEEMKQRQTYALVKLQEEAISALYSCLNSKNDVVRLRAALSVMERVDNLKVGCTDPDVINQEKEQNKRVQGDGIPSWQTPQEFHVLRPGTLSLQVVAKYISQTN